MSPLLAFLLALMAVISPAFAQEVAYAYGDFGGRPLESGNITPYNNMDIVASAVASASPVGRSNSLKSEKTVDEIADEINHKLNVGNPEVRDEGRSLILEYPGDGTINQICSIYEHMVGNWSYARDTRGIEEFQYSNQSLEYGKGRFLGQGDCDDFSILMASLIESIGGTSRIILAYGPNGGHAYTEVYLGKVGGSESDVQRMITWLRKNYNVKEINTHTDLKTGDVWLNLDWWKEPGGAKHPGGPFFKAANQMPIPTRESITLAPLMPMNDPPEVQFTISPSPPIFGENASFDASNSRDIGGRIDTYLWDFGDGNKTGKMSEPIVNHVYLKDGPCTVILTVEDDEGATNISSQKIVVNNPPQANFTIMPQKPIVGDQVKFDASSSNDEEDGKNLTYHWEINNNSAIFSVVSLPKQIYDEMGMYWINLTVTDKNGANGHKNLLLKINQPPIPHIIFDSVNLSVGRIINFSAGTSEDADGEIISYAWDFGDNSAADYNKTVLHSYHEDGKKTVRLSVKDNDGAISNISLEIFINRPPTAKFSLDPVQPKKGELVSFDASASSDPDGKIQRYLWDFGVGRAEPEVYYLKFAEHTYSRPGEYNVTLTVEDDKGATASTSHLVEVEENDKPNVISLLPDKSSPQVAGAGVTFTATASDPENDPLQYMFVLDNQPKTNWMDNPGWTWTTSATDVGSHSIDVRVKDSKHNPDGDSSKAIDFVISASPNNPPVVADLAADQTSPQVAGATVTFTVKASDPENDLLQYMFLLDGQPRTDFTENPSWTWTTAASDIGSHIIEARVKDNRHNPDRDSSKAVDFVISAPPNNPPAVIDLVSDPASPQVAEATVTFAAKASDPENDPLQYMFLLDGQPKTGWADSPRWTWTTSSNEIGSHIIEAIARDNKHNPNGDSALRAEFVIVLRTKEYRSDEPLLLTAPVTGYESTDATYPIIQAPPPESKSLSTYADTPATIVSQGMPGYQVFLNGTLIGTEGTSGDALDGRFSFRVVGNQSYDVRVYDGQFNYPKTMYFQRGIQKIINVETWTPESKPSSTYGDTPATIVSQGMPGYQVFLNGTLIGTEGTSGDALDGRFSFRVVGNQSYDVRVYDGQFNYPKTMYFQRGIQKIINVEPGTAVYI